MFVSQGGNREMEFDDLFIFLFPCGFLAFRQLICYETFTSLCQMPMSRFNPAIDLSFLKFFQSNCKTQFFLLFFMFLFFNLLLFSVFCFGGFPSVFRGMQAYFALIDGFRHYKMPNFHHAFFLNIFCSKCSFFLNCWAQIFYMQDVKQNVWRDKKKFHNPVILFLF